MRNSKTLLKYARNFFLSGLCAMAATAPALAQETMWLEDGESQSITAYFLAGETISATCDEDCGDLDLHLYTPSGRLVDSDELEDAFPVVIAPSDGDFRVTVTMFDCSHSLGCEVDLTSDEGFVSY